MQRMREFLRRLAGSLRRRRTDADLEEELRLHAELEATAAECQGHTPGEAARIARLRVGDVALALDRLRDQRGLPWLTALKADLVFAARQVLRHRVASLTVVLSLGLAMGATLAAFRLVDAVLLRPLRVANASQLFFVTRAVHDVDGTPDDRDSFDYPTFRRYITATSGRADLMLIGMTFRRPISFDGGDPEQVTQQFVSGNVFPLLGLQPAAGRLFTEHDDVVPDGHQVAVITYDFWQRRFGRDAAVAGRTFRIGTRVYQVVGVTRQGFSGTEPGAVTDLFLPSMMNPDALHAEGWSWSRSRRDSPACALGLATRCLL